MKARAISPMAPAMKYGSRDGAAPWRTSADGDLRGKSFREGKGKGVLTDNDSEHPWQKCLAITVAARPLSKSLAGMRSPHWVQ